MIEDFTLSIKNVRGSVLCLSAHILKRFVEDGLVFELS